MSSTFGARKRILATAVVAVAAIGGLAACGGGSVAAPPPSLGTVVNFTVPARILNLPLVEADGTTTKLAAYQGKTVMIADFLSLCTDICPLISANTAAMSRALTADGVGSNVALLEISVDPHRDTPARLTAYQKLYGTAPSNWTLLTATPANTRALWKYFHVQYDRVKEPHPAATDWLTGKKLTYDVDHADDLIFLDGQSHERFIVQGAPSVVASDTPPKSLVQFLNPDGLRALYKPRPADDWTVAQGMSVFSWMLDKKLSSTG